MGVVKMQLDLNQIEKILPQKDPFILIDKVTELEPGEKVVAVKDIKTNDWFFKGHFPGHPVMPGALIIEAMAQTSILLYYSKYKDSLKKKPDYYLGAINKATFKHPVGPGDQLKIEARTVRLLPTSGFVSVKAFVKDKDIAEAELVFGVKR